MSIVTRFSNAWNAFLGRDPTNEINWEGNVSSSRPDRIRLTRGNERTILTSIYNRIALDVAAINIDHVRLDDNNRYMETIYSGLHDCLSLDANLDQTARAFIQDLVMSMFDEGCIAVVPVDTTDDPTRTNSYDIKTMRVSKILEWKPMSIKVKCYNENTGFYEELWLPKNMVAIIENPFYAIMNEPNSTFYRLKRKLAISDQIDDQKGAQRLDMIIQLPFSIRSEAKRKEAERRRKDIENQLSSGKYGIAYADATEHITQLNRSIDNQLNETIKNLTEELYSQLGITQSILDGSADEKTMLNYQNRTMEPILAAICDEFNRKFLTKTARTQKQRILYFRDPFKLVPIDSIAEIADKFTRNEIMTSNEIRQAIGMKPAEDPRADELVNSNISQSKEDIRPDIDGNYSPKEMEEIQNG